MGVVVECYSGSTYPERPVAFYKDSERLIIKNIVSEWRTPVGKHFRVKTIDGHIFELVYDEARDEWQIQ